LANGNPRRLSAGQSRANGQTLADAEAKSHIGETATVCGKAVSTPYASTSTGKPTYIDLGRPYPRQVFTIVIRGPDRAKFGNPETTLRGKSICATGKIQQFRGVPEVTATKGEQIKVQP
jgi:DNA/RNA endonuclease YhcR with UshA esterase domain